MRRSSRRASARRPVLVCLDALEPVSASDATRRTAPEAWLLNACDLVNGARAAAWDVVHVLPARPAPGAGGWRTIPGLAPAPSEPVFHRDTPSAFQNPDFVRRVASDPSCELILVGASVRASGLATAVEGSRIGALIVIATDAMAMPAAEWEGVRALARLAHRHRHLGVRTATVRRLLDGPVELRLIQGGRK